MSRRVLAHENGDGVHFAVASADSTSASRDRDGDRIL